MSRPPHRVFVFESLTGGPRRVAAADVELAAAGRAMRDAVVADLLAAGDCAVSVAVGDAAPELPAGASAVRAPAGVAAPAFVAAEARRHDRVWAIAPETGCALAALCRAVGPARWIGCDAAAIASASSKLATLRRAAERGLATPLDPALASAADRWVVKPDDGAGAVSTRVHHSRRAADDDLAARRARGEAAVVEAWVDGEPLSLSLLCGRGDTAVELASVNRQRLALDRDGALAFEAVEIDVLPRRDPRFASLRRWAGAIAAAFPGLRGYVGVDLVWHPLRGPVLIEVNPRVTMAYVGLSAALGRNLAREVLAAHDVEFADAAA